MAVWHTEATTIERTECTLARAAADLVVVEQQLAERERTANAAARVAIEQARQKLRPIVLALRGDARDLAHVNLPARINWLTIQVGNYSGRPTAAQSTWIAEYARQTQDTVVAFETLKKTTLADLGVK
jgi:hypothetical protein